MKIINVIVASSFLFLSSHVLAETPEVDHSAHHPAGQATAAEQKSSMPKQDISKSDMAKTDMKNNMSKMQDLMQKIRKEKSPEKRQQLMKEHMDMMQNGMKMMVDMKPMDMMSGSMMSGDMMMDDMKEKSGDAAKAKTGMMCDMSMMENHMGMMKMMMDRMEMMQMMMDQMMQHQAAEK